MMTVNNFSFYTSYFAFIAEAGLNRARDLYPAISISSRIDVTTILNRAESDVASRSLQRVFDTSYEYLWSEGQNTEMMRPAFEGLAKYVLDSTGLSVNEYLEQEGIKVSSLYGRLSNIFGQSIEDENLE